MEPSTNKKFIIISIVLMVLLIVSGYFNYQYYKEIKAEKTIENIAELNLTAKVLNVGQDSLTVDKGSEQPVIKVGQNTVFNKTTYTPSGPETETSKLSDIKEGMVADITLNSKNNFLADSVNIITQNLIGGIVKNINNDQIEVDLNGKTENVQLMPDTKYYLQKLAKLNQATDTIPVSENTGLSEISIDQIKAGGQVTVFLVKPIEEGNFQAKSVLLVENN